MEILIINKEGKVTRIVPTHHEFLTGSFPLLAPGRNTIILR